MCPVWILTPPLFPGASRGPWRWHPRAFLRGFWAALGRAHCFRHGPRGTEWVIDLASWYYPWVKKSYGKANMALCLEVLGEWQVIPTYWPSTKEWDFVVKMMEAAALSDTSNLASVERECGARLNLAKYLASMTKLPGLQPFTMTTRAKDTIANAKGWGPKTYAHLEGDSKIEGKVLDTFPADDELFENWEEFCVAYAYANTEHIQMQKRIAAESKL